MTERAIQAVISEETVEESSILTDESRFHLWRKNDKESRGSKTIEQSVAWAEDRDGDEQSRDSPQYGRAWRFSLLVIDWSASGTSGELYAAVLRTGDVSDDFPVGGLPLVHFLQSINGGVNRFFPQSDGTFQQRQYLTRGL